jgi:hypothetical protein
VRELVEPGTEVHTDEFQGYLQPERRLRSQGNQSS